MINDLLLKYTRSFPVEVGKNLLLPSIQLPKNPIEYTNRYSAKFLLDTSEYQMRQIYLHDLYEKNTVRHLVQLIKPTYTFFDVGSNIGFYAITFAKILEKGSVHCFEPNHISFERLKFNVGLNSINNIILNETGLSNKTEEAEIAYNLSNTGTASVYKKPSADQHRGSIQLMKMDDYCSQKNITQVDLIKVDIEGGELPCIQGAEYIIRSSPRLILVLEMMEENFINAGYTSNDIFKYILDLGFHAYLPKSYPFNLRKVTSVPDGYADNMIFLKGY